MTRPNTHDPGYENRKRALQAEIKSLKMATWRADGEELERLHAEIAKLEQQLRALK